MIIIISYPVHFLSLINLHMTGNEIISYVSANSFLDLCAPVLRNSRLCSLLQLQKRVCAQMCRSLFAGIPFVSMSVCTAGEAVQTQQQTDVRSVHVYENQRWNPVTGYTDK